VEPDPKTANFVRHTISRAGHQVMHVAAGKDALTAAWRDQPDVIVIELALPDIDGLDVVRRLRSDARTARTPIVSLTKRGRAEDTMAGLQAGLTEYIVKQADAVDTLIRLMSFLAEKKPAEAQSPEAPHKAPPSAAAEPRRATPPSAEAQRPAHPAPPPLRATPTSPARDVRSTRTRGHIMVFLSAKGGVGTSSVCLNIASRIAQQEMSRRTVVVDMVLPIGSLAQISGVEPSSDLVRLTEMEPSKLDTGYLRDSLPFPKAWGFHLVPGTDHPRRASLLQADRLSPVIEKIQSSFDYVVFDVGRNLSRLSMPVLSRADILVMVLSPTPAVVENTRSVMEMLTEDGIPPGRFFILTNRPVGAEDMSVDKLEKMLGRAVDAGIPTMGTDFNLANTLHVPLQLRFPDSTTTLLLNGIAANLLQRFRESSPPG
jgi:MinD-like ATPase involved in chromosome partitioning or flagellar assembly/CheY-like chemotaxis protein